MVLLPYVLSHLTAAEYGFWAWILAMTSYLALTDLGLSQGNVRPLALAVAAADDARVSEIVGSTVAFHALVSIGAGAATWTLRTAAGGAGIETVPEADSTLALLLLAQAISLCGLPFASLLSAVQRLDLVQRIQAQAAVAQVAGTVVALELGGGLLGLAWVQVGLAIASSGARLRLARRFRPGLRWKLAPPSAFRAMLASGAPLVMVSVLGAVTVGFERAILALFAPFSSIAQYAIAARLVIIVRELPQLLVVAILPASAALDVSGDEPALVRLYLRAFKLMVVVVFGAIATIWVAGDSVVSAWLGPGFESAGALTRFLAPALLLPMLAAPGLHLLAGRSRLGRLAPLFLVWTLALIAVNSAWLAFSGFAGAGLGLVAVNLAGTVILLARLHARELPACADAAWGLLARAVAGTAAAGVAGAGARMAVSVWLPFEGRAGAALEAIAGTAAVWLVVAVWALLSGFVDGGDRSLVSELATLRRSRIGDVPRARGPRVSS